MSDESLALDRHVRSRRPAKRRVLRNVLCSIALLAAPAANQCEPATACKSNADCKSTDYCHLPDAQCGEEGRCETRPQACITLYDPVCGCDGNTHSNACVAAARGVSVRHEGPCTRDAPFCGGIAGFPCPGQGKCIDDPSDDCDPNNGGADCGGICVCPRTATCAPGSHWDSNPAVCRCVPDLCPGNPCATVLCRIGTRCVEVNCKPVCEPFPQ